MKRDNEGMIMEAPNLKWSIEIQKSSHPKSVLRALLDALDCQVIEGDRFPEFSSALINNCGSYTEAFNEAKKVRRAFAGSSQVDVNFRLGAIIDHSKHPKTSHHILEVDSIHSTMQMGSVALSVSPSENLSKNELEKWKENQKNEQETIQIENLKRRLRPAYKSSRADKILELMLEVSHTGDSLFRIFELALEDSSYNSKKDFLSSIGLGWNDYLRFSDTIHNAAVSGDWARHATQNPPKTSNPMTKKEAEIFSLAIGNSCLEKYY